MASMTKLSTKEIIEQRDRAFEALRGYARLAALCHGCGKWAPDGPVWLGITHDSGCIVALALEEQP